MKHFLNRDMLAPNVMTVPIDQSIVAEFADSKALPGNYSVVRPPSQWHSDIQWISAADEQTFERFQSAFDRLGIGAHTAPYLDLDRAVRLYAGFLVVRSECHDRHFHVDWSNTNNEAFTCLALASPPQEGFGLAYKKLTGEIAEYDYRPGEAIVFGDRFTHATNIGRSPQPVVLLCFVFGTDKMQHWPSIHRTVGYQVTRVRRPDGAFVEASGKPADRL